MHLQCFLAYCGFIKSLNLSLDRALCTFLQLAVRSLPTAGVTLKSASLFIGTTTTTKTGPVNSLYANFYEKVKTLGIAGL